MPIAGTLVLNIAYIAQLLPVHLQREFDVVAWLKNSLLFLYDLLRISLILNLKYSSIDELCEFFLSEMSELIHTEFRSAFEFLI